TKRRSSFLRRTLQMLLRIRSLDSICRIFCLLLFAGVFLTFLLRPAQAAESFQDGSAKTKTIEIPFTSYDGYEMSGKLTIPVSGGSHPVVIYVQTAEGMTVDMKRPKSRDATFNYFDLYRD